jgi:hypothetical protein
MKIVKERAPTISAVSDETRQVLPSKVIWDGTIDLFEVFRNNVEGYYGQIGAGYLSDSSFHEAYLERGVYCYVVMLIFWMKYLLLLRSRRMNAHYMAHFMAHDLVHAKVV